eukprot:2079491-Amphidinium_carterae.1
MLQSLPPEMLHVRIRFTVLAPLHGSLHLYTRYLSSPEVAVVEREGVALAPVFHSAHSTYSGHRVGGRTLFAAEAARGRRRREETAEEAAGAAEDGRRTRRRLNADRNLEGGAYTGSSSTYMEHAVQVSAKPGQWEMQTKEVHAEPGQWETQTKEVHAEPGQWEMQTMRVHAKPGFCALAHADTSEGLALPTQLLIAAFLCKASRHVAHAEGRGRHCG